MVDSTRKLARISLQNRLGGIPLHSVLIALSVCLLPYAKNQNELFLHSVLPSIVISVTAAAVLVTLIWPVVRSLCAAGVIATLIIVCLAYYGHFFDAIDDLVYGVVRNTYFMPIWVGLFLFLVALAFVLRSRLYNLANFLNVGSVALVLIPLSSLTLNAAGERHSSDTAVAPQFLDESSHSSTVSEVVAYRDIYYLIFDRYADMRTLSDLYGYDNSSFLDYLGKLGFYIPDQSRSNYTKTAYSLASSLNLKHLTYLSELIGPFSTDWKPLFALLQDHEVGRFLKGQGYHYVHLGSWWGPTKSSGLADETFDTVPRGHVSLNEFESLLVGATLPIRLMAHLQSRRQQFVRVQEKFNKLSALRRNGAPLFVFAHMLIPHNPFVFFPDGRYKTSAEAKALSRAKNYIDQVDYVNQKITELVNDLLQKEPQPIIVIQSDEGPFPTRYIANTKHFDWREATVSELKQKFGILSAIYFPDRQYERLYKDITPVNTFRIIFNKYFGENLPLLPDRIYSHYSNDDLYSFIDVTEATK